MLSGVMNHVRLNYVDSVHYHELARAAIEGILRSLDPHSHFFPLEEWRRRSALERGELATTGIFLEAVDGRSIVLGVSDGSPAAKAGVMPGDRIVTVNDTAVAGLDVPAVELRLAGEKGSRVRLLLERGPRVDPDTLRVTLKRAEPELRSVSVARMADSVTAYVALAGFGPKAADEVHDALDRLSDRGAKRAILDLRGNPGGLVVSAVEVAAEFLPKETLVFRTEGRKADANALYSTEDDGDFRRLPLILLIDERSASASEALAGALQDHDRALILGRRSFGKALVQAPFVLPTRDVVWLTISRVVTPSGRIIQRRYRGLEVEQYRALAGRTGEEEDALVTYRTDGGRVVRGGRGIAPDVHLPAPAELPVWFSVAADSGFVEAVADSVAATLPADLGSRARWFSGRDLWADGLVPPFLARIRERLGVDPRPEGALRDRIARILAARVAEVRWGPEAREEFLVQNDPDIRAALDDFSRLPELLAPAADSSR